MFDKDCPEKGKGVAESATEMVQIVLPNDTNLMGNLLGGTLMHWIDQVGAVVANRHSRRPIVTASMERIDFHAPVHLGSIVILQGRLVYVGKSSMEVAVTVYAENGLTGERLHTSSATLTFVAVGDDGKSVAVPALVLTNEEEQQRYQDASDRHRIRKSHQGV